LVPGEAVEGESAELADRRTAAIGADEPASRDLALALGRAAGDGDAVRVLAETDRLVVEAVFDAGARAELARRLEGELPLLAVETERILGVVPENAEIELGDEPIVEIAELPMRNADALAHQIIGEA